MTTFPSATTTWTPCRSGSRIGRREEGASREDGSHRRADRPSLGSPGPRGGFVLIPLLSAAGIPIREAVGTSLLYVVFVAVGGAWGHLRHGTVDWVLAVALAGGAIPAAPLGSLTASRLPAAMLEVAFAGLAFAACAGLFLRRDPCLGGPPPSSARAYIAWRRRRYGGAEHLFTVDTIRGLILGAGIGFISGLLGLGGGWILVPLMVLVMEIPVPIAVGTSLVVILAPALTGALAHYLLGNFHPGRAVVPLVLAGVAGARVGAWGTVRVPERHLKRALVTLLVVGGGYMLLRGLAVLGR